MSQSKKIRVCVLMGGRSPEHEISLISGREVVRNLNPKKYDVIPTIISRDGERWHILSSAKLLELPNPMSIKGTKQELVQKPDRKIQGIRDISKSVDVVFVAMHGPFGEDGTVQGMLDLAGIKYTGPGLLASAIGIDKIMFRKLLSAEKIKFPNYISVEKGTTDLKYVYKSLGKFPYFVKPYNQGSSVGSSIAENKAELKNALINAFQFSDVAIVDEYVSGLEVTCGVIGNKFRQALPLVEIHPLKGSFFDYESKYSESGAEEIVPANVSKRLTKEIQSTAVKVYKLLGCRGFSRVDFIIKDNKHPVVLEINTIPGLTPMSLLPKSAKVAGYEYSILLDKIIEYARED